MTRKESLAAVSNFARGNSKVVRRQQSLPVATKSKYQLSISVWNIITKTENELTAVLHYKCDPTSSIGQSSFVDSLYTHTNKPIRRSPARQQIWPSHRSKVTIKVTTWYHRKGLVTKNTHAKYQSSICNSAKVMAKVKVFVTDGQMRFNVPALSRGTI